MKEVYTLDDLVSRDVLDAGADQPARYAVIGHPVAHSASPRMHQAALDALGIAARYIRIDSAPDELLEVVDRMRELEFTGANITVPHKLAVMEACTEIDPAARVLGAVNTLHFSGGGVRGFNTDAPGFRLAVEEAMGGSLAGASVFVIGAGGGAGQAIAMACAMAGVGRLVLANRTREKLESLGGRILLHSGHKPEIVLLGTDDPELSSRAKSCDVIVQTTSVGLKPDDPSVLSAESLAPGQLVYDTIYQPAVTPLLALSARSGCRTANGSTMLLHQGALSFRIWHPGTEPLEWMRKGLGLC